ncbi:hypothetical protein AVT69_gp195 [Pseudomonas phage PhiPA3]|uniref:Uncharacterized protein 197 n=1 Tax=Pseudomonas phage PhiPA3 TaxID=998086 RepID=F8SK65_BPPA3|nr:hypothetical protein AVT69_gp195 [Pseudomonas phage PhiPA3]AEH03620.1 hypothetical protein [Pseudomonas phage PhiPA3]
MSSIIRYNIKTANKPILDVLHLYLGIRERVDEVNKTVIDGTTVELNLVLVVNHRYIRDYDEIADTLANLSKGTPYELYILSNRFLFSWMTDNFNDLGGLQERYQTVLESDVYGTVYDTTRARYTKTPEWRSPHLGWAETFNRGFNSLVSVFG